LFWGIFSNAQIEKTPQYTLEIIDYMILHFFTKINTVKQFVSSLLLHSNLT